MWTRTGNFLWDDSCYGLCMPKITLERKSVGSGERIAVAVSVQSLTVDDFRKCVLDLRGSFQCLHEALFILLKQEYAFPVCQLYIQCEIP